jgi:hypothetical protein
MQCILLAVMYVAGIMNPAVITYIVLSDYALAASAEAHAFHALCVLLAPNIQQHAAAAAATTTVTVVDAARQ